MAIGDAHQSYTSIDEAVAKPGPQSTMAIFNDSDRTSRIQTKKMVQLGKCRKHCRCCCHQVQRLRIARFGSLEISGFRFPHARNYCDDQSCEEPNPLSIKASICLPPWVAWRMLSLWFTSSPLQGPELLLRVPRMVSRESPIVKALEQGHLTCFKRLVAHGKGSPYDVDEHGNSFIKVVMELVYRKYHSTVC